MDEITKIIVDYNAKEILLELNKDKLNSFDTFLKILSEKTGEENIINNFELMPINTSMPYILIDQNNFINIISEKIKDENLKLFMNKKEKEDENENNNDLNQKKENENKRKKDDNDDDFSDNEDEIILNKENKEINNEIIDLAEKEEKNAINENNNEIIEDKDINNENIINKELDNIFENKNNPNDEEIKEIKEISNEKSEKDLKNKNEDDNIKLKVENKEKKEKIVFENEVCMKCSSPLYSKKILCLICSNMVLCSDCEPIHGHPCVIFKSKFLSSLKETFNFMTKQYNFDSTSSKKNKINLSLSFIGDNDISLRPKKGVLLPIRIMNHSTNSTIYSGDIIILIKGNKILDISYDLNQKFKIPPESDYNLNIKCITTDKLCRENITMEIYSNRYLLKENKNNTINLNIEVNEDKEEEELNLKLLYNHMVISYNKEHKKILVSLIENELKDYDAEEIVDLLIKYGWNKEKFLKNLKK